MSILNSNLISFPDDFDPSIPALPATTPNTPTTMVAEPFAALPELLPQVQYSDTVQGSAANATAAVGPNANAAVTLPAVSAAPQGTPAPVRVDPTAVALSALPAATTEAVNGTPFIQPTIASPLAQPTSVRSLRNQTSASFVSRTAAAASRAREATPVQSDSPAVYTELGLTPPPTGAETAGATRTRHGSNEAVIAGRLLQAEQNIGVLRTTINDRHRELTHLVNDSTRTTADGPAVGAVDTAGLSDELNQLRDTVIATRNRLGDTINQLNGMRTLRSELDALKAAVAQATPSVLPSQAPTAVDPLSAPLPDLLPQAPFAARQVPTAAGPSQGGTGIATLIRPREEDTVFTPSKKPRTGTPAPTEHFDVHFYDVVTTGEARDIARAALTAIPYLSPNCFSNAIRVRNKPGTISIRFRVHANALSFIHAIEQDPPKGLEGMHACWAPAVADPISVIRGDGFAGRSG
ncbi:hypothetical protein B0H13DRAFT_798177 [Mycena leptocephala]|nr:hypothetical protein B0H13DRAFT_798177 [Mycena leptocephala]